jgi:fatty acid desaturase
MSRLQIRAALRIALLVALMAWTFLIATWPPWVWWLILIIVLVWSLTDFRDPGGEDDDE